MTDLSKYQPVDPYAAELAELRAASATPMSRFEERWASERTSEIAKEHAAFTTFRAAQAPTPRTTAAELARYEAPCPYSAELKALRAKEAR